MFIQVYISVTPIMWQAYSHRKAKGVEILVVTRKGLGDSFSIIDILSL